MTPTRTLLLFALLVPSATLAQAPSAASGRGGTTYQLSLPGASSLIRLDTVTSSTVAPGDMRTVFRATVQVFKALKVPTDLVDSARGEVGSLSFTQTSSFAGKRMSQWLRCGEGMTGPNADYWRIYMAVLSGVERVTKDSTRVRTLLAATARDMSGGASNPIPCATTGQFETMIGDRVLKELAKGS